MALFGEKYPEIVRVVAMGEFSRELCGGTHLDNVGQVGLFKIVGEESVSAGTRRITALTGKAALDCVRQEEEALGEVAAALKVPVPMVAERVAALLDEVKTLKKQARHTQGRRRAEDLARRPARRRDRRVGDVKVVAAVARREHARRAAAADRRPPPQGGDGSRRAARVVDRRQGEPRSPASPPT